MEVIGSAIHGVILEITCKSQFSCIGRLTLWNLLELFMKCFKELWFMCDKEGMSMWRDISCFFTKNGWIKAYVPFPLEMTIDTLGHSHA